MITQSLTFFAAVTAWPGKILAQGKCHTSADVSGPFHRAGAPFRTDLTEGYSKRVKGDVLEVSGTVFGDDCETPLKDAVLDLWHADPTGEYVMTSDRFLFRARVRMDGNGHYVFRTLIPSPYRDGGLDRPRHIHYIVTAPGHRRLVTQLYFEGDERLDQDTFVR